MKVASGYIRENKKRFITIVGLIVIFIPIIIWSYNNYNIYKDEIVKVIKVEDKYVKTEQGPRSQKEKYYFQTITGTVKNGDFKGKEIKLTNTYSTSMVDNEKYKKGDDLFVKISEKDGQLIAKITEVKRDKYIVIMIAIFIIVIIAIAGNLGLRTIMTLVVNIGAFIYFLNLYVKGESFQSINIMMIVFFSIITLLLLGGLSRKNIGAMISTLITISIIYVLYNLCIIFGEEPHYELIEYVTGPNDIENIFLSGILIGCLGAVMDVCITINSAINELRNASQNITIKEIVKSVREIGHDIMGTMINVLMFSYIGGSLTIVILKIINGYRLASLIRFDVSFEIIRFLIGSIGIVMAVPISAVVGILLLKRGMRREV